MKVILRTKQHTVYEKKSGRFAVKDAEKNWVNGDDKVAVLLAEGLVKTAPQAVAEAPVEEAPAEETAVEEAPVEEAPAKETAVDETAAEEAPEKDSVS
jgi:hypothetical protein